MTGPDRVGPVDEDHAAAVDALLEWAIPAALARTVAVALVVSLLIVAVMA